MKKNYRKKKKGFTLVEMLAVIMVIVALMVIVTPKVIEVINSSKNSNYEEQLARISSSGELYATENSNILDPSGTTIVSLQDLSDAGYLTLPIINPKTGEPFDPDWTMVIITEVSDGVFTFEVEVGGSTTRPILTLNGVTPDTVACSASGYYNDLGADVTDPLYAEAADVFADALSLTDAGIYSLLYSYTNINDETATKTRSVTITNTNTPTVSIAGGITTMNIVKGSSFTPPSATATDVCEGSLSVMVDSDVVPTVVGTYTVEYTATNLGDEIGTKTVTVNVTPSVPTLAVIGSNPATVACASAGNYTDPGADVTDPLDAGAANVYAAARALKNAGSYSLSYSYTNAYNETGTTSRTLNITNTNVPVITITGGVTEMTIAKGSSFTAPGSTGTDACEGTITVNVSSNVNVNVVGDYTVTYNATNLGGTPAVQKTVTVHVVQTSWNFEYTGAQQSFTVSVAGTYNIRAWGGDGGTCNDNAGGMGGYAEGEAYWTAGTTVYVYIGGKGAVNSSYNGGAGGWNGGGDGGTVPSGSSYPYGGCGGGGASDLRVGGTAFTNRIIVASGGGGAGYYTDRYGADGYYTSGTDGAGTNGGKGALVNAGGAASTGTYYGGAGSLGTGGDGYSSAGGMGGGGGGAGYYGGGAGANGASSTSCGGGASGGSYIGGVSNGETMGGDTSDGYGQIYISIIP